MSNRHEVEGRTIHPRALKELGDEACIVALEVARDLRSGVIPPEKYYQGRYCGTACCIAGHIARRFGFPEDRAAFWVGSLPHMKSLTDNDGLFTGFHSTATPQRAADAIERYVYDGSETPWVPS